MEKEYWKDIEGYEDYQVSDLGNVKSLKFGKEKILKPAKDSGGYLQVNLYKNGIRKPIHVAILVAKAFPEVCGEYFEGAQVDHINTDRTDNRAVNIRVCTHPQNCNNPLTLKHYSEAHKGKFGAEHNKSKPVLQFSKDGRLIHVWACAMDVTRELGVNNRDISACCLGKRKSAGGYIWRYKEKEAG